MRKIVALALPLIFLSLITVQANAVITPVEVEREHGYFSLKIRGDHRTASFLFHYENLYTYPTPIRLYLTIQKPSGMSHSMDTGYISVPVASSIDTLPLPTELPFALSYGDTLTFTIIIRIEQELRIYRIEGSVVIPPP